MLENIDEWRLVLDGWRWERLTSRDWPLFSFARASGEPLELREMRPGSFLADGPGLSEELKEGLTPEMISELEEEMKPAVCADEEALKMLYHPSSVEFRQLPEDEEEFNVFRIEVDGVVVRFVEEMDELLITVEGTLPEPVVARMRKEIGCSTVAWRD